MSARPAPQPSAARVLRVVAILSLLTAGGGCRQPPVPPALGDHDFWNLIETLSEPPGTFELSENLVSNEPLFVENVRVLRSGGGVYVGVGPEQNFSYIAKLRPSMAFIIDIRRENRNLHLLYKALFELSADRGDFVSRLFSRPRPDELSASASVDDIFTRFDSVPPSRQLFGRTRAFVKERLVATHAFQLSDGDLEDIEHALAAFYDDGPAIQFWGSRRGDAAGPSYRQLMTARDARGQRRSFLANESAFRLVKQLQSGNHVVPIIGDFAGAKALRRLGDYLRSRAETVSAFYASNVGIYLTNEQARQFCTNLWTLPVAPGAVFMESNGVRSFGDELRDCRDSVR